MASSNQRPIRLAYQPPANSTFLSEQISRHQPASSTFLSEQISRHQPTSSTFLSEQTSTSRQPPAKRTGCKIGKSTSLRAQQLHLLNVT
jgi:hypothetical protein